MTWVCLKMMYTPSSWKVFHRDRIFLNQSMLGVTLCSDKAISGWWFGTMEFYDFPYIRNFIIPTDELIFFRGVGLPPTIYIYIFIYIMHGKYQPLLVKLYQYKSKHATYNLVNHNFPMSELRHSHHTMVKGRSGLLLWPEATRTFQRCQLWVPHCSSVIHKIMAGFSKGFLNIRSPLFNRVLKNSMQW